MSATPATGSAVPSFGMEFWKEERLGVTCLIGDKFNDFFYFGRVHESTLQADDIATHAQQHIPASCQLFGATCVKNGARVDLR